MHANFYESVRNHMIEKRRSTFVTLNLIDRWMRHYTGHTMKYGPIDVIGKLDKPLLMLHSREDRYSTPEYAEKLYDLAGCEEKRLVWFDHGKHSMLRITDTELYDESIAEFLAKLPSHTSV
jgi:esterase/lipase